VALRVASINIERSRHLARVEGFLRRQQPHVLCLQELCARDIPFFEGLFGQRLHYAPMMLHPAEEELEPVGVGLVATTALAEVAEHYYVGSRAAVRPIAFRNVRAEPGRPPQKTAVPGSICNAVVAATVGGFRIATTHLTVTPHGTSTPRQRADARALLVHARAQAAAHGGLLLTGDFNAPRGRATFSLIAQNFVDGVPPHHTTSIDGALHRAGPIPFMVDGLFHTPSYRLENAALHTGVSDHMALTATLARAEGGPAVPRRRPVSTSGA